MTEFSGIQWIKEYRMKTGLGLKESKDAYDRLKGLSLSGGVLAEFLSVIPQSRERPESEDDRLTRLLKRALEEWYTEQ